MATPINIRGKPTTTQAPSTVSQHTSDRAPQTIEPVRSRALAIALALLRIGYGLTFLWAFFDKLLGLGFATKPENAVLSGGSPTKGFFSNSAEGPFKDLYLSISGAAWADVLFMVGLLGIGLALTLGIGIRIAGVSAAIMYVLMWTVALPPTTNPVIDDHILGAIAVIVLALALAGDTWGLGRWWSRTALVQRAPVLR